MVIAFFCQLQESVPELHTQIVEILHLSARIGQVICGMVHVAMHTAYSFILMIELMIKIKTNIVTLAFLSVLLQNRSVVYPNNLIH